MLEFFPHLTTVMVVQISKECTAKMSSVIERPPACQETYNIKEHKHCYSLINGYGEHGQKNKSIEIMSDNYAQSVVPYEIFWSGKVMACMTMAE